MASKKSQESAPRRPPATTPEARENQMIALAMDLAERQLREGTASAQVITHYLKAATVRETLEREKLKKENILLEARANDIENQKNNGEMYERALAAMRSYQGHEVMDEDYED